MTYNARGDVTDDGTYAYSYDANDRLIVVTPHDTAQLELKYGYDSQGRRLWKTAYTYTGGVWSPSYSRHYLWDGSNLVAELDGSNAMLTGYTWGPMGLLAVTDYTATGGPKTYVVAQDLSGNVAALVDPTNGMPVASYRYDPYGKPTSRTGPEKNLDDNEGKEEQSDKEDRNLGFSPHPNLQGDLRVVNYVTNEFMQRDVAGELAGGFNLYQLDGGDPINRSDPSGQDSRTVTQVSREAIDEAKKNYGDAWKENYDWIYDAKIRWYRSRDISITVPDDGRPSMYYIPPTRGEVVKQVGVEAVRTKKRGHPYFSET